MIGNKKLLYEEKKAKDRVQKGEYAMLEFELSSATMCAFTSCKNKAWRTANRINK